MFDLIGLFTWLIFGWCAVIMVLGCLTLRHHIRESNSAAYVYWLAVSMLMAFVAFLLMGIQTGDAPIVPRPVFIPWIRLFWLVSNVTTTIFFVLYWRRRIEIKDN